MPNPKDEAKLISNALFDEFGTGGYTDGPVPHVDGRGAIIEMKNDGFPGWQDVEWAGYHVKYLALKTCEERFPGQFSPYTDRRRRLIKGQYLWDTRFNANEEESVILGDVQEYNSLIASNGGIGILVADTQANYDLTGDFVEWHEALKGGSSAYSIEREMEGRPPRRRKTEYMIRKIRVYYFKPEDLVTGVNEGWLNNTFQVNMRNANEDSRNPKYKFKISEVPSSYLIYVKNFNEDAEEFAEEFPEFVE
jgi:hypothetical protein